MNSFSLNLNKLHSSIQELGVTDIKVQKKAHQITFEGITGTNIKLKFKLHESCLVQTSPAAWEYCANPNDELWVKRVSFLNDIPNFIQDIINNKRFDASYLNTITEKKEDDTKEEKDDNKKEGHKYEFGCLMASIDDKDWTTDFVKEDDLYYHPDEPKEQYGREEEPHISILFGFEQDKFDMKDLDKFIDGIKPIDDLTITGLSTFEQDDYDVLKYDVVSETLHKLNSELRDTFPYQNEHPKYHAHITVAYIKSGEGEKYIEKYKEPKELPPITKLVYSFPSGDKKTYKLKSDE